MGRKVRIKVKANDSSRKQIPHFCLRRKKPFMFHPSGLAPNKECKNEERRLLL